jgi:hypothetical protein
VVAGAIQLRDGNKLTNVGRNRMVHSAMHVFTLGVLAAVVLALMAPKTPTPCSRPDWNVGMAALAGLTLVHVAAIVHREPKTVEQKRGIAFLGLGVASGAAAVALYT